jgi:hypothetical protein
MQHNTCARIAAPEVQVLPASITSSTRLAGWLKNKNQRVAYKVLSTEDLVWSIVGISPWLAPYMSEQSARHHFAVAEESKRVGPYTLNGVTVTVTVAGHTAVTQLCNDASHCLKIVLSAIRKNAITFIL